MPDRVPAGERRDRRGGAAGPSAGPPRVGASAGGPEAGAHDAGGAPERHPWRKAWVGREQELAALAGALVTGSGPVRPVAICALQGMGGVGKTYLAERFAWEHAGAFPGGVKRLAMRPGHAPSTELLLGELGAMLEAPAAKPAELRARLLAPRALVHVDNADDKESAEAAAGLARALDGGALVVTGRYGPLGRGGDWTVVPVAPFDETTALAQLEAEIGSEGRPFDRRALARLARELGYLPLGLSLAAAHLRDGLSVDDFLARLHDEALDVELDDPTAGDSDPRRRNLTLWRSSRRVASALRANGSAHGGLGVPRRKHPSTFARVSSRRLPVLRA